MAGRASAALTRPDEMDEGGRRYAFEPLGKRRKEFAGGGGPRGPNERARVSPLGPGLERSDYPGKSSHKIVLPLFARRAKVRHRRAKRGEGWGEELRNQSAEFPLASIKKAVRTLP